MRRVLTSILLLASLGFWLEIPAGYASHGEDHHEPAAVAAHHLFLTDGGHGHQDGSRETGSSSHRHGTSADHCSHSHLISLPHPATLEARPRSEAGAQPPGASPGRLIPIATPLQPPRR